MSHVRQQIRERVGTTLGSLTTTSSRVYQSRVYPLASNNLPGLLIYTKSEESEPATMGSVQLLMRNLTLIIEGYVKAVSNFDDTVDTIASEVEVAMGNDETINGLAKNSFLDSTDIEYDGSGDQPVAVVTLSYTVEYETLKNAPDSSV
jgi:hypothetical protein|tara:strand:- start:2528 stop:2971 length:444 start_codon:yes stop_codon:yes gene_type:complete